MIKTRPGVKLTPHQATVVYRIQPFTYGYTLEITRGKSTPEDQLRIIGDYANKNGVVFQEFDPKDLHSMIELDGKMVYTWQRTWSRLLHLGVIINPPLIAKCLELYKGEIGRLIYPSPHIISDPIDFSGGGDIDKVEEILIAAKNAGCGIRRVLKEAKNNCVHIDLEKEKKYD